MWLENFQSFERYDDTPSYPLDWLGISNNWTRFPFFYFSGYYYQISRGVNADLSHTFGRIITSITNNDTHTCFDSHSSLYYCYY
jgi:hypothetical protein